MSETTSPRYLSKQGAATAVVVLTVIGAALRIHNLNSGLWYDEIKTVLDSVRPPLLEILTHFPGNNDHLFFSILAHISTAIFGEHPWSVRLPAVLFGVASIPMLYLVGTTVSTRLEALLSTCILTVSYHHIWFSQDARGYTALLFWVLLATFLLLQWILHGKQKALVAYPVVAALGSYTHLTMVFVVVAHAIACAYVLIVRDKTEERRRDWRRPATAFVMSGLLTVLLYAPVLTDMHRFFAATPAKKNIATPIWALWAAIQGMQVGFGSLWVVAAGSVVAAVGLLSYFRQSVAVVLLFVLPASVTPVLVIAMGQPIRPRFVFFLIGFGLLIAVRGATAIGNAIAKRLESRFSAPWLGAAMAVFLTVAVVGASLRSLPYGYRYPKQDYRGAIDFVERTKKNEDVVVVLRKTAAVPIRDYFGKAWTRVDTAAELRAARARGKDVLLVYTMADYVKINTPGLWNTIQEHCTQLQSFAGTVAGAAVYVDRCPQSNPRES